jgi:aryl-alcohol dehydrogenase-like predicted oxidoreductase
MKRARFTQDFSPASLRQECESSLRRLQVETIDLYQMHWPPSDNNQKQLTEAWETLAALKQEGKVRWIGVSNFKTEQFEFTAGIAPITSLQPPYSIIRRAIEEKILPECEKQGIVVNGPRLCPRMIFAAATQNFASREFRKILNWSSACAKLATGTA